VAGVDKSSPYMENYIKPVYLLGIMDLSKTKLTLLVALFSVIATFTIFMNAHYLGLTGQATGVTNVTVYTTSAISTVLDNVYLGNLTIGDSNSTQNGTINDGFQVQNDGNVPLNISMSATNLFSSAANPSSYYLFLVSDAGNGTNNESVWIESGTILVWTNVPATNTQIIEALNDSEGWDIVEVDINITVPVSETAGLKESTVTFTGSSWA